MLNLVVALALIGTALGGPAMDGCGTSIVGFKGERIFGGRDAIRGEFPWQISLQDGSEWIGWRWKCGGTILNERYIISAAHCTDGFSEKDFRVAVGAHERGTPTDVETNHKVTKIIQHEEYRPSPDTNDIVLLRIDPPIDFSKYNGYANGACLPTSDYDPSFKTATASGWGATNEYGSATNILQTVDLPVWHQIDCSSSLYYAGFNGTTMICAGYNEGGKDTCQGDSGGPLVQDVNGKATLIGVVSWGVGCAKPGWPGVYAKVTNYIKWIETNAV